MKPTLLLGAASALMRSRKAKIIFVGLQFGYLAYKLISNRKQAQDSEGNVKD